MGRSIDNHSPTCECTACIRKRRGELSRRSPRLGVQVSHEEAELVRQAAASEELSLNAWLRRLVQERFQRELGLGEAENEENQDSETSPLHGSPAP